MKTSGRLRGSPARAWACLLLLLPSCLSLPRGSLPKPDAQDPVSEADAPTPVLRLTLLDVGQGDATLVQTASENIILIDAGRDGKGEEVVLPYLQSHGISHLDAIVATHYDGDHIGGVDEVIRGPDQLLDTDDDLKPLLGVFDRGGEPFGFSPSYPEYVQAAGTLRQTLAAGGAIPIDPESETVTVRCVVSGGKVAGGAAVGLDLSFSELENSASVGLLIEAGSFRYFTAGDLTGGGKPGGYPTLDVENAVAGAVGRVNAVHVNHHGSLSSSHPSFVNTLLPQVALFQVGDENDYHHPDQEVLGRWRQAGADLWLTEKGTGGFMEGEHVANAPIEIEVFQDRFTVQGFEYPL